MDIKTNKKCKMCKERGTSSSLDYRHNKVQKSTQISENLTLGQVARSDHDSDSECVDSPHSSSDRKNKGKQKTWKGKRMSMDIRANKVKQVVGNVKGSSASPVSYCNDVQESTQNSKTLQLGQVPHDGQDHDSEWIDSPCSPSESQVARDDHDLEYVDYPHSPCVSYSYSSEKFTEEELHLLARKYADIALNDYNKKHRTNYEIVEGIEDLHCCGFLYSKYWSHCNFRAAKPKKMTCGEGSSSTKATTPHETPSTELFFAELCLVGPGEFKVTCCCILKGGEAFPSCTACEDILKHPMCGFREGWKHYTPYTLRSHLNKVPESTQNSKQLQLSQVAQDDHSPAYVDYPQSPCASYSYSSEFTEETYRLAREYAEIALEYYNKKHRTKFEVVEGMEGLYCYRFLYRESWIHCNFRAVKPKKMPCGEGSSSAKATTADDDPSTELFFTELLVVRPSKYRVTCCCILKGGKAFHSCDACHGKLKHPLKGFSGGCLYTPYALRSRSCAGCR